MSTTHASPRRSRAWLGAALPLIALTLGLAACGGSSASTTTTTTIPGGARSAAFARYAQCLVSHGVPASIADRFGAGRRNGAGPAGTGTAGSVPPGSFTPPTTTATEGAARQACASLRPTGGFGAVNPAALAAYLNCLKINGVTIPTTATPTTTPAGTSFRGGLGRIIAALRSEPAFATAQKACVNLLPRPGSTSTTVAPGA